MRQSDEGRSWSPIYLRLLKSEFRGYNRTSLLADMQAGLTVACVALPLALAFGVASGSTAAAGLVTAIIAGILIGVLSGGAHQISGPTGAMSAVLIVVANQHGPVGLWVAGALAGLIVLALGVFRLGRLINLIPEPVIVGFTSGIAIIIAIGQIDNALGIHTAAEENAAHKVWNYINEPFPSINMHALLATLMVIVIMVIVPHLPGNLRAFPAALLAIAWVTLLAWVLDWPVATIGSIPRTIILDDRLTLDMISLDLVQALIGPAIAIAALGAIESLLAGVVTGRMTGNKLHADQELVAQGVGNIILPFFGGVPATAAIARMSVGVRAGGLTRMTSIIHAVALLISAFALASVIAAVPMPALAGVLLITAWRMNDWAMIRQYTRRRMVQATGIVFLTMAATVSLDLTRAIGLGMVVSLVLFLGNVLRIRGFSGLRSMPRLYTTLVPVPSDVETLTSAVAVLHAADASAAAHPHHAHPRASIHEATLVGPLYFGSINAFQNLLEEIEQLDHPVSVILDLSRVPLLDETGASALHDLWRVLHLRGQLLKLVGLQPQPLETCHRTGVHHAVGSTHFHDDMHSAITHLQHLIDRHPQRPALEPERHERPQTVSAHGHD